MTRVVHCKVEVYDVYIGRPSTWGNPFTHKATGTLAETVVATRDEAVRRYELWMRKRLAQNPALVAELLKLDGKVLGCWCKPAACHGDVLIKLIEEHGKGDS